MNEDYEEDGVSWDNDDWLIQMDDTDRRMMNLEFNIGLINLEIMECCFYIQQIKCLLKKVV